MSRAKVASIHFGHVLGALGLATVGLAASCATAPAPAPAAPVATATFADQVTAGQTLYGQHCAKCQGNAGQGDTAPRVVGLKEGALPLDPPADRKYRKTRF